MHTIISPYKFCVIIISSALNVTDANETEIEILSNVRKFKSM